MPGELLLLASFVNHWLQALDSQIVYAVLYGIARTDSKKQNKGGILPFKLPIMPGTSPGIFSFRCEPNT